VLVRAQFFVTVLLTADSSMKLIVTQPSCTRQQLCVTVKQLRGQSVHFHPHLTLSTAEVAEATDDEHDEISAGKCQ